MYRVYIRVRPLYSNTMFTFAVNKKTSQEAYNEARRRYGKGFSDMPGNSKKHRRGNGEGSIYQRKDGSWAAVLTVGTKPDGKPDRKFLYGKTRKEVADKLRDAQNKIDVGVMPGGNNILFGLWIKQWLELVIKPGIKKRTYKNYSTTIDRHIVPGLGGYKLKDLTEELIQKYLTEQQEHGNLKMTIDEDSGEPVPSHGPVAASS